MKLSKKIMLTATLLITCSATSAFASTVEFTIGSTNFAAENNGSISQNTLEAAPFINESSRTMVPIRAISDAFGATTLWNGDTREVTVTNADKEIKLTIDSTTAYINNEATVLDSSPVIVGGRTFVPLRFIGEAFAYNVNYVSATSQVVIDDTPIVVKCGNATVSLAEYKNLYNLLYYSSYDIAKESGSSDEEISSYTNQVCINTAFSIAQVKNTFPSIGLIATDHEEIRNGIIFNSEFYSAPMSGLNALVHEKYYFSLGRRIIETIASTTDFTEIYNNDYVCAKHILVEDEALANSIYDELIAGSDFDAAIKEYNTDPGMEQNPDGYVFTKGEMVEEFETESFNLEIGKISKPVKTDYGYHIIKREALPEITEATKISFAQTKANEMLAGSISPELLMNIEELEGLLK